MGDTMSLPVLENGFGGAGMGAGFIGGLVLGSLWNGNGFGFGGNRGAGQVGADIAISNQLEHVSDQVQQAAISQLQSANGIGAQIANTGAGVIGAVNQNTIAGMQGNSQIQQQLCCATGRLSGEIDQAGDQTVAAINAANIQSMQNTQTLANRLCGINSQIISQGYENRLQAQGLATQLQNQHADLSRQIFQEGCANRELQREIQTQAIRDKLAETQAKNAALEAQINLTNQLTAQTAYLISRLEPTTTTPTAGA